VTDHGDNSGVPGLGPLLRRVGGGYKKCKSTTDIKPVRIFKVICDNPYFAIINRNFELALRSLNNRVTVGRIFTLLKLHKQIGT